MFGKASSPNQVDCIFLPWKITKGSNAIPAALHTPRTVMFFLPAPGLCLSARFTIYMHNIYVDYSHTRLNRVSEVKQYCSHKNFRKLNHRIVSIMPSWCPGRYVYRTITYYFTNNFSFWWVCRKSGFITIPDFWSVQLRIFGKNLHVLSKKKREYFIISIIFALKNWYLNIQIKPSRISSS